LKKRFHNPPKTGNRAGPIEPVFLVGVGTPPRKNEAEVRSTRVNRKGGLFGRRRV